MDKEELIPHLFRNEFRKIIAVLCKAFGIEHISLAEDIAGNLSIRTGDLALSGNP